MNIKCYGPSANVTCVYLLNQFELEKYTNRKTIAYVSFKAFSVSAYNKYICIQQKYYEQWYLAINLYAHSVLRGPLTGINHSVTI